MNLHITPSFNIDRLCKTASVLLFLVIISILINQWIGVMIVKRQSDIVNTKESILPVCDKPFHTKKRKVQKERSLPELYIWSGTNFSGHLPYLSNGTVVSYWNKCVHSVFLQLGLPSDQEIS